MITDAILNFMLNIAQGFWALVPAWEVEPQSVQFGEAMAFICTLDGFLPFTEVQLLVLAALLLVFAWTQFKWAVKFIDWIRG